MADRPTNRRDSLGAVLLAALLALSVVAGTAGFGAAQSDADHIVRNGDDIVVHLGDDVNVTNATSVMVIPEGDDTPVETVDNATETFRVPVTNLSAERTDLRSANVTVRVNGTDRFTETVDLSYLRFGDTSPEAVSLAGDGLRIPLSDSLGYAPGASVSTTFGGEQVSGTVRYDGNRSYLALSLTPSQVLAAPSDPVSVVAGGQSTTVAPQKEVVDATSVTVLNGETLVVTNPLFVAGSSYDVVVRTTGPDGRYANATTANASGALAVRSELFATADSLNVSVYTGGDLLVGNVSETAGSATVLNATVTDDGRAVDIAGASLTANETAVWLTNATGDGRDGSARVVRATVPVENGTVNLTATDYRLNENASYRLIVAGDDVVRAAVQGNESADDSLSFVPASGDSGGDGEDGDGDSSDGSFSAVPGGLTTVIALITVLLFGVVVVFWVKGGSSDSSSTPEGVESASMNSPHDSSHAVDVRVEDAATDSTVAAVVEAKQKADNTAYRTGGPSSEDAELPDGTGSLTLDRGKWSFEAKSHGVHGEERDVSVPTRGDPVTIRLGPKQVAVTVVDASGDEVSNVPVTCTPETGQPQRETTDDDGDVSFDVPLAADEAEVSVDPDRYDGDSTTVSVAGESGASATLDVDPLAGDLDVTATVEGTPVAGLTVEVRPSDDAADLGASVRTATTDDDGAASFADLLVGEYEVGMDVPGGGSAFSVESTTVTVTDGRTARTSLDASFEFVLGRNRDDRIASIRQDVDALVSTSGRDVAIPRYYGSVVTDLLETVQRLPREGHRFARADADPGAVADALLDAAESSVELVNDAMTTKRNTDLFGACVDMTDHRVEWQGGYDVETLFELLDEHPKNQRHTVRNQLRAVDGRINDERSDLAVVAPARELWDGVKAYVTEDQPEDPVRGAAVAFAAGGLLDAVDELFDHEKLRERLQRTVF